MLLSRTCTGVDGPASLILLPWWSMRALTLPQAPPATKMSPTRRVPRWIRTVPTVPAYTQHAAKQQNITEHRVATAAHPSRSPSDQRDTINVYFNTHRDVLRHIRSSLNYANIHPCKPLSPTNANKRTDKKNYSRRTTRLLVVHS